MEHPRIRILLADDQPEMLETVTRLLKEEFNVIGTVANGKRAIEAAARLAPDLVVLDISMPVLNGIEAAARLKESGSLAKAIFLTVNEDPHIVEAALSVGGRGYVLKQRLATDLIAAIRHVLSDRIFVSPPVRMSKSRWEQPILT
jgi:DNA-binding NarL/FixJ family response regulator